MPLALVDNIGIELEVEKISQGTLASYHPITLNLESFRWSVTHDASCETPARQIGGIPAEISEELLQVGNFSSMTLGGELVSSIMDVGREKNYDIELRNLCRFLRSWGESEKSYRAGIHIHVNCPINLEFLKNFLLLGAHLEQVFFLLGGMGYDFRGERNDSTYCRPITKFGPPCVPVNRGYAQCFTIKDLLAAENLDDFQIRYGNHNRFTGTKYVPMRYTWLNLKSLFERGSLEFRIFNKTLNYHYIWAVAEFCRNFVWAAMLLTFKPEALTLVENSAFDLKGEGDREKIIRDFTEFCNITKIDIKAVNYLLEILSSSKIPVLENKFIYSHLMHLTRGSVINTHWTNDNYHPATISEDKIKIPNFVDIHVLNNSSRRSSSPRLEMPRLEFNILRNGVNSSATYNPSIDYNSTTIQPIAVDTDEPEENFEDEEFDENEEDIDENDEEETSW